MTRTRVLLADDHLAILDRLKQLLEGQYDIVATFSDPLAILGSVGRLHPDVLVMDISMPIFTGLDVARRLRETGFKAKIIFLTVHDDPDYLREAQTVGANGYILKHRLGTDLVPAIEAVMSGGSCFPADAGGYPNR